MFLAELREKHLVEDTLFLVDGAPWLQAACFHHGLRFQHETYGNRNSGERMFKELKRRTEAFANYFRHSRPETAETWLQAFAVCDSANLNTAFETTEIKTENLMR